MLKKAWIDNEGMLYLQTVYSEKKLIVRICTGHGKSEKSWNLESDGI